MIGQEPYQKLPGALLSWFHVNARALPWRADKEPYHVWLSEIMLQQTRVEAVKSYYLRFLAALPTVEDLAQAEEDKLLKLWEGLGYYNRARNMQKAAKMIVSEYGGVFPSKYEQLLALPGVGEYTAGAVSSICFELPCPAVDGNVLRVLSRITESFDCVDDLKVKRQFSDALRQVYPEGACGDFTQSLMELGATICVPNGAPSCALCPCADFCQAKLLGTQRKIPIRKKKKERRVEEKTVFLLWHNEKLAVKKRQEKGVLHGLWELPNVPGILSGAEAAEQLRQWGVLPVSLERECKRNHIFTHIEWQMISFSFHCDSLAGDFVWADAQMLKENIPLPSAFKQFLTK